MNFTAIILAGGQSKRMGANKALLHYKGKPLILYSVDLALCFTRDIIISANNHDLEYLGFPIYEDSLKVHAPLAGIHAGLQKSHTPWNLVLTCDMPNVTTLIVDRLVNRLNDQVQIVLPAHDGYVEPLCGFYHRDLIPAIEMNIAQKKLSPLDLLGMEPNEVVLMDDLRGETPARLFKNVNGKGDLLF